jgi:hypothetical protein
LTVTDIATPWTEELALKNKVHRWIREAMDDVYASFPVPLKGIDSDNGGEFINTVIKTWCEQRERYFTRTSRTTKTTTVVLNRKTGMWSVKPQAMPAIPMKGLWWRCTRPPTPCSTISTPVPSSLIKRGTHKGRRRRSMNSSWYGMMFHGK